LRFIFPLNRFEEELEQIDMKNSIGGKGKRHQHAPRLALIRHTMEREKEEFDGCGLEMPDLFDADNAGLFREWEGELRLAQNIKMKMFTRKHLTKDDDEEKADEAMVT
jgi:translation machinery-associated protein 16